MKKNTVLQISLDRPSGRYCAGENAVFRFLSSSDAIADVVFTVDGQTVLEKKTLFMKTGKEQTEEKGLPFPGFIRCEASVRGQVPTRAAAAFEPENIRPLLPERTDFQNFWDSALHEIHSNPADLRMKPAPEMSLSGFDFYRVSAANSDGSRIHGYLSVPRGVYGPVPLLVTLDGYGPGFHALDMWSARETLGVWKDPVCTLCLNVHDFEPSDDPAEFRRQYEKFLSGSGKTSYLLFGMDKPETCWLRRAVLGCVRISEAVAALPCVDPERVVWAGSGQGGDFGLYLCALTRNVFSAAYIGMPDFAGAGGRPEFARHTEEQRLFDGVWHAARIRIPVLFTVGYADETSYPGTVYPILRSLKGERLVLEYVGGAHDADNTKIVRAWIRSQLKLQ